MREIKFRAWDKVNKKVRKVMSLDFYNTRQSEVTLASDGDVYLRHFEQVELMQYTGLKDKNGIEIYEGDIIGIDVYYVDDFGETYKERNYAEVFREQSGYWDCDFKDDLDSEFLIVCVTEEEGIDYPWNITVEGNIYEYPLVKESK